jgi:hypothetical protein
MRLITMLALLLVSAYASTAPITLNSANQGGDSLFNGLLLEGTANPTVAVVLLHGRCAAANGPVVEELRNSLNRAGYTTLSIDTPLPQNGLCDFQSYINDVAGNNYVFPELYARIRESINHLQTLDIQEVVIVGFSLGSRFGSAHIARGQLMELPIIGLVGVGMYATSNIDPLDISLTIDEVTIPVLDLYGDEDFNAANTQALRQAAYLSSGMGTVYTQVVLDCGANLTTAECHQLSGLKGSDNQPLEYVVNTWMDCFAPLDGTPICAAIQVNPPSTTENSIGGTGAINLMTLVMGLLLLFGSYARKRL